MVDISWSAAICLVVYVLPVQRTGDRGAGGTVRRSGWWRCEAPASERLEPCEARSLSFRLKSDGVEDSEESSCWDFAPGKSPGRAGSLLSETDFRLRFPYHPLVL